MKCLDDIYRCCCNLVGGEGFWNLDLGGEPHDSIFDWLGLGFPYPYTYKSLIIHVWFNVPAFNYTGCPCFANSWFFMDQDLGSWWREGFSIIIKFAKYLIIGGELGVNY